MYAPKRIIAINGIVIPKAIPTSKKIKYNQNYIILTNMITKI